MLAVIDETTPSVSSGICYAVISAILLTDEAEARSIVRSVIPAARKRPFHWAQDGPVARGRMIEALETIGVIAAGVDLLIERRTPAQDGRDQAALLKVLRRHRRSNTTSYGWDTKSNELLWIADAIAGAVHDHLVGLKADWFDRTVKATALTLMYRRLPPPS